MLEALQAEYKSICEEQRVLREKLLQVNLRKMIVAVRMTATLFGKPPPHLQQ